MCVFTYSLNKLTSPAHYTLTC